MRRPAASIALVLAAIGGAAATARAEPNDDGGDGVKQHAHAPYRLNMRIGTASTDRDAPTVCGEVRIWSDLAVESCGTGSGLWTDSGVEMMHIRGTWEVLSRDTHRGRGAVRVGAGIAELSVGPDKLGLQFGEPSADRVSTAGPEASVSAQWTIPLGKGLDAIGTFTTGVGYFSHAPELILPHDSIQPFASVEAGVGW